MWGFSIGLMWVLLVLVMFALTAVILLQEGKGGGLAEAFGGAGAETFGVKATGIDRFTAIAGTLFLLLSVLINLSMKWREGEKIGVEPPAQQAPFDPAQFMPPPEVEESPTLPPATPVGDEGDENTEQGDGE